MGINYLKGVCYGNIENGISRPIRAREVIHSVEKHVLVLNQEYFPKVSSLASVT